MFVLKEGTSVALVTVYPFVLSNIHIKAKNKLYFLTKDNRMSIIFDPGI